MSYVPTSSPLQHVAVSALGSILLKNVIGVPSFSEMLGIQDGV